MLCPEAGLSSPATGVSGPEAGLSVSEAGPSSPASEALLLHQKRNCVHQKRFHPIRTVLKHTFFRPRKK